MNTVMLTNIINNAKNRGRWLPIMPLERSNILLRPCIINELCTMLRDMLRLKMRPALNAIAVPTSHEQGSCQPYPKGEAAVG